MLFKFIITRFVSKVRVWQTLVVPICMWAFFGGRQRQMKNDKNVASFKKSDEFCNLSTSSLKYMFQTHSLYETALNHLSNAIKVEASDFIKTTLKCRTVEIPIPVFRTLNIKTKINSTYHTEPYPWNSPAVPVASSSRVFFQKSVFKEEAEEVNPSCMTLWEKSLEEQWL